MKKIFACLAAFVFTFSSIGHAQQLSLEDIKAQMIKEWERAKIYTIEYLNAMPADRNKVCLDDENI
jgi:hypothetical protein